MTGKRAATFVLEITLVVCFVASFGAVAFGQAWKEYAAQLKRDAASGGNAVSDVAPQDVAPNSSGRLLDFSAALGDDGSDQTGVNVEEIAAEPTSGGVQFAPDLPSYRALPTLRGVSRLNDVYFVDARLGWAVGDRGVILRTEDGGETWRDVSTNVDANLRAVSFYDEKLGIAVGGRVAQGGVAGLGVILRTEDGGETWEDVPLASFPILRAARVIEPGCLWAAGDSTSLYPSGLFTSEDGGREWTTVEGGKRENWRAALYDPIEALGVGATLEGSAQTVSGEETTITSGNLGSRRVADVAYDGARGIAWLVGSGGLVENSTDFGASWRLAGGALPFDVGRYFDLTSVVANSGFVGAVGAPGSLFFYSDDAGATWSAAPTGATTPLRSLYFVDRSHGWAVGDYGVILATTDGGRTWRTQRGAGARAAILGVFGRVDEIPFEAYAQLAGDEGFLTATALLARDVSADDYESDLTLSERLDDALVETGANPADFTDLFTLNPEVQRDSIEQILARFDAENDGEGLDRFREALARAIRAQRPDVLIAPDPTLENSSEERVLDARVARDSRALVAALVEESDGVEELPRDPFRELIMRELPRAIRDAADPTVYPAHISSCALEPWRVRKVLALRFGAAQGNVKIDSGYFCATLGRPVGEIAARARSFLGGEGGARESTEFQTVFLDGNATLQNGDRAFFDGVPIPYGSPSRRLRETSLLNIVDATSARAAARRANMGVLGRVMKVKDGDAATFAGESALAGIPQVINGSDPAFALDYITAAGNLFASLGRYDSAEAAFASVPEEFYGRLESRVALAWLLQYYSGTEPAYRLERTRRVPKNPNAKRADGEWLSLEYFDTDVGDRILKATSLAERLRDVAPDAFMAPELRFSYAATQIAKGDFQGAMRFYLNRALVSKDDLWGTRAAAEYWLRAPQGDALGPGKVPCPLRVVECRPASARPYLDGELESEVWDAAARTPLTQGFDVEPTGRRRENLALSTDLGTSFAFLYDADYLYFAVTCPKPVASTPPDVAASSSGEPASTAQGAAQPARRRDASLRNSERVELLIDLDGDYATGYRIEIDKRGWVSDSLWGDKSWNPRLFVATQETNGSWTAEGAIPLAELSPRRVKSGDVWRAALRRVAPGLGVECWNVENSDRGENAFGFLRFL